MTPVFKPYEGNEPYIFVSYSHKDSADVFPILQALHEQGLRVWYDMGIDPGSEWPEEIANHLLGCGLFLLFMSPNAAESHNVRREITMAIDKQKPLLNVYIKETELQPGLQLQLNLIQYISYVSREIEPFDDFIGRLTKILLKKVPGIAVGYASPETPETQATPVMPATPAAPTVPTVPTMPASHVSPEFLPPQQGAGANPQAAEKTHHLKLPLFILSGAIALLAITLTVIFLNNPNDRQGDTPENEQDVLMQGLEALPGEGEITDVPENDDAPVPEEETPEPSPEPTPEPQPEISPPPQNILDAVGNLDYWVRITIDRSANDRGNTIFEREINSNIWLMTSITGNFVIADPTFRQSGNAIRIEFATTTNTYTLNDGAVAAYGDGIGVSRDDIAWYMEVGHETSLGSEYGEDLTSGLAQALSDYRLIGITVSFNNGQKAVLYRNIGGTWNLRPRDLGLSSITPSITYDGNTTIITFEHDSEDYDYKFYEGGRCMVNGETASWSYAYYVR